jgi:hypothetical protein
LLLSLCVQAANAEVAAAAGFLSYATDPVSNLPQPRQPIPPPPPVQYR